MSSEILHENYTNLYMKKGATEKYILMHKSKLLTFADKAKCNNSELH